VGDGYKDGYLIDKYARAGWPPEEIWNRVPPVSDPPDGVTDFLRDWAQHFSQTRTGDPVDPGAAGVYLNPAYDPHQTSPTPYAYVAFGPGGVYAPLVLTTTDYGLDGSVSTSKADLGGIDNETSLQLLSLGLTVDAFAGAWQGLVQDALGVTTETATSLISEARDKSKGFIGSVAQFSGVDQNLAKTMSDKDITGPAALANAEATDLAGKLGISQTFAQRLIDQAQSVVPSSQWSLEAPSLGYKTGQLSVLASRGIKSQGQLHSTFDAASDQEKAQLAGELGQEVGILASTVGGISFQSGAQLKAERLNSASVTSLAGVNVANKEILAKFNVKTVGDLATKTANDVAGAFGGSSAAAGLAIAAALEVGKV
jgi:hypothetical protein